MSVGTAVADGRQKAEILAQSIREMEKKERIEQSKYGVVPGDINRQLVGRLERLRSVFAEVQ